MFNANAVKAINIVAGESGAVGRDRDALIVSALSSVPYYERPIEKVCSVVRSVMQNHPFIDGNKRTGVLLLAGACRALSIPFNKTDDEIVAFAVASVVERWTVDQIVQWVES